MFHFAVQNTNEAWRAALGKIFHEGEELSNPLYFRDELCVFEISDPILDPPDSLFPMNAQDLAIINDFIWSGRNEEEVCHEWTKLYHHRLFDEPNAQVPYMVQKLKEGHLTGEIQASLWDKTLDQDVEVSPCTQVIWCRVRQGKLESHVHAHSSDAYKKLLMNLQEFVSLHLYIANESGYPAGRYFHIIDSCHIHHEDRESTEALLTKF